MEAEKQTHQYRAPQFIIKGIERMMLDRQFAVNDIKRIQSEDDRAPDQALERQKQIINEQIDELQKLLFLIR